MRRCVNGHHGCMIPFMTSPDISKSTGMKKYTMATPIKNNGQIVGMLCGNVELKNLSEIVKDCNFDL